MNSIIEQIHYEASTAEMKLLENAKQILSDAQDTKVIESVEELKSLGFTSFKQARQLEPKELERVKELQAIITKYREIAFNYKFMTEDAVFELCKKFGLVQAPVNIYIDSIPVKNQKDLIAFSRDEKVKPFLESLFMESLDVTEFSIKVDGENRTWDFAKAYGNKKLTKKAAWEPIKTVIAKWESYQRSAGSRSTEGMTGILEHEGGKLNKKVLDKYAEMFLSAFKVLHAHKFINNSDVMGFAKKEGAIAKESLGMHPVLIEAVARLQKGMTEHKIELKIIAPKHMLKLEGFEIDQKFRVVPEGFRVEAPAVDKWFRDDDPIIQAKVNGGWLNVTAWGDEANMPGVANEVLN